MTSPNLNHTIPGIQSLDTPKRIPPNTPCSRSRTSTNYALVPAVNWSASWMEMCCDPYPVYWPNGCYVWCGVKRNLETGRIRRNTFEWCLIDEDRPFRESRAFGWGYDYPEPEDEGGSAVGSDGGSGAAGVVGKGALGVIRWGAVGLGWLLLGSWAFRGCIMKGGRWLAVLDLVL